MGPAPSVAAVRLAVRRALAGFDTDRLALVACSGGADSTALAAAVAFDCRHTGRRAGLVTVDHQLQVGSGEQAHRVAGMAHELGFDPVRIIPVQVGTRGGLEAAARTARYAALGAAADGIENSLVLLGHTADDQAETVLLGLGRGSGARSIAGMRPELDGYLRPLLGLRRVETQAACAALGLAVFDDPHNLNPRFTRVRLRREVLPLLEDVLSGGVVAALARTASQLREDCDALDFIADRELARSVTVEGSLAIAEVATAPDAVLSRVLRLWAQSQGAGALTSVHIAELAALVRRWRGQGPIPLPGGVTVTRSSGRLCMTVPLGLAGATRRPAE